ncbi:MAG: hypothetical protein Kow0029_03000 [Candidatus Rifleibacteriota bacterium]
MVTKFMASELKKFSREKLYQIAQELNIKGRSKLNKAGLVEALLPFSITEEGKKKSSVAQKKNDTPKTQKTRAKASGKTAAEKASKATSSARKTTDKPKKSPAAKSSRNEKTTDAVNNDKMVSRASVSKKNVKDTESGEHSILNQSFAKKKSGTGARKKQGVMMHPVAIPVEIQDRYKTQKPTAKAEEIEQQRSKRHASLKTTMEIPVFSVPSPESAKPITEEDLTGDLPADYGETRIVVQVRDPHWAHAYWQIPRSVLKRLEMDLGIFEFAHSHFVLRVHNVTDGFSQEFKLSEFARSHYFYLEKPNTVYQVELGLQSPTEGYTFIALSNMIQTPADRVASFWASPVQNTPISKEERIAGHEISGYDAENDHLPEQMPGLPEITDPVMIYKRAVAGDDVPAALLRGSGEGLSLPERKLNPEAERAPAVSPSEMIDTIFSAFNEGQPTSCEFSLSSSSVPLSTDEKTQPGPFLSAAVEMVLYGTVERGARLTFNGHRVKVAGDGSYSLRIQLPENESREIELKAENPVTREKKIIKGSIKFQKADD